MRIAQVAPLFESVPPKTYGGTERVVSYLTEELVKMGHEVTLFASGDSVTSARLAAGTPESLRLSTNCVDQLAPHIHMLEDVYAEKDNFDVLHFHLDYLHFPSSRREQVVNMTTLHGRLDIPDLAPVYRTFHDMPVVSISLSQRKPLSWANWIGNVYHGLPQNLYTPQTCHGKYLAFLGRISPEKRVDRAIEIAKLSGIPLKIAAKVDRADQEYYDAHIKPLLDHSLVEYIGEIGYPEKNDFLRDALALVFPIDWPEPFGLVMIEAMACGTPVIAYPRGSVPEVIDEGVTGYMVANAQEAARATERISKIDRRRCRARFEQRFSARRMATDYLALYERLIGGEPAMISLGDGVSVG